MKIIGQLLDRHKPKLKNTFWLVGEDLFRRSLSFILLIFMTRYLGVISFGKLSYALNFLPMLPPLASLGTDKLTLQALVHYPKKNQAIVGTALFIRAVMGMLLIPVIFLIAYQLQPQDSLMRLLIIIATSGVAFEAGNVLAFWFQAKERLDRVALARSVAFSIAISWRLVLILKKASLITFAWSYLGERLLVFLCLLFFFRMSGGKPLAWRFDLNFARDLVRKGFPIMLTQAVILLYLRLDIVFLQYFKGAASVGIYALAAKLCEPLSFLGLALIMAFSPALISTYKKMKEKYWQKLAKLSAALSSIAYLLVVLVLLFGKPLIIFIFGQEYSLAGAVLGVLILNIFFVFIGDLRETTLILEKQQAFYFFSMLAALFASVLLNLNLIPRYGVYGVVWTKLTVALTFDLIITLLYPPTRKLAWTQIRSLLIYPLFTEKEANKK
ncbi:flippase [Candidatus Margulisiibacteriota bacterium]